LPAKTAPTLDSDSRKWSSVSCHTDRRGFRAVTFGGLFFCGRCSSYVASGIFRVTVAGFERTKLFKQTRQTSRQELRERASQGFRQCYFHVTVGSPNPRYRTAGDILDLESLSNRPLGFLAPFGGVQRPRESLVTIQVGKFRRRRPSAISAGSSRKVSANSCQRPRPTLAALPIARTKSSGTAFATEMSLEASARSIASAC